MDRLHAMTVFVAVADAGSFSKAAEHLRLSPPAVTRAVSALEERLGVRLLTRTTRSLSLTEAGARYLATTRQLLEDIEDGERAAAGEHGVPTGRLAVTASVMFSRLHLMPVIGEFLAAQPKVAMSLLSVDRVTNLVDEGIDVAVRIGDLEDSTLRARRVGYVRRLLVASPDYLEQHGAPDHPKALKDHQTIAFTSLLAFSEWRMFEDGRALSVRQEPRLQLNDPGAAINAAEAGLGITQVLSYMVRDALATGRLVTVLEAFAPPESPVHLVYPEGRALPAKTRAFLDFAAPRLEVRLAG